MTFHLWLQSLVTLTLTSFAFSATIPTTLPPTNSTTPNGIELPNDPSHLTTIPRNFRVIWEAATGRSAGFFQEEAGMTLAISTLQLLVPMSPNAPVYPSSNALPGANLVLSIGGWPLGRTTHRDFLIWGFDLAMTQIALRRQYAYGTYWLKLDGVQIGYITFDRFHRLDGVEAQVLNNTITNIEGPWNVSNGEAHPTYNFDVGTPELDHTSFYKAIFKAMFDLVDKKPDDEIAESSTFTAGNVDLSFKQQWLGQQPKLTYRMAVELLSYAGQLPYLIYAWRDVSICMFWQDANGQKKPMAEIDVKAKGIGQNQTATSNSNAVDVATA